MTAEDFEPSPQEDLQIVLTMCNPVRVSSSGVRPRLVRAGRFTNDLIAQAPRRGRTRKDTQ